MRLIKMMGLAAVAAMATMALFGVGSASAQLLGSVICHLDATTTAPCPSGELPYTGEVKGAQSGNTVFTSGFITITCPPAGGVMEGKITSAGSATTHPHGLIEKVVWTGCTANFGCTVEETKANELPWLVVALGTKADGSAATLGDGTLHVTKIGNYVGGQFRVNCFGVKTLCIYGTPSALVEALGEKAGGVLPAVHTQAAGVTLTKEVGSGGACSATGNWKGLYNLTTPSDLLIHLL